MFLRLATLALLALSTVSPTAAAQFRETLGGPLGQFSTDAVEAPRVAPVERWRARYDAVLSDPVVHDGRVAVAVQKGRAAQLVVLDLEDGSELFRARIKRKAGPVGISLDEVYVTVVTDQELVSGEFRGGKFKRRLRASGAFCGVLATGGGHGVVPTSGPTRVYDLAKGRLLAEVSPALSRPLFIRDAKSGGGYFYYVRAIDSGYPTTRDQVEPVPVENGPKIVSIHTALFVDHLAFDPEWPVQFMYERAGKVAHVLLERLAHGAEEHPCRLHIDGYGTLTAEGTNVASTGPGVVWEERLIGRLTDRTVWVLVEPFTAGAQRGQKDVEILGIVDGENLPEGAVDAPMSAARGVLLLGNWAVDIKSTRVLWVAPDLDVEGRLIPADDGVVVFASKDGALVCAGEPEAVAKASGPALLSEGALGDGAAIVLRDGTRLAGDVSVDAASGAVTVERKDAGPRTFGPFEVAAVESQEGLGQTRLGYALFRCVSRELSQRLRTDLIDVAEQSAKFGLVANARRLVEEIERLGATGDDLETVQRVLSTKKELRSGTRTVKLAKVERAEEEARARAVARRQQRVQWLTSAGARIQAGAVLAEYWRDRGALGPETKAPDEIAAEVDLIRDWDCSATRWLQYAETFAPADARYATKAESKGIDAQTSAWERSYSFTSPRISLLTHERSFEIVGGVLRFGEGTIEALERLLGADPAQLSKRFDVRLHANREAYLKEEVRGAPVAPRESAGIYIPAIRTSRFYVPDVEPELLERQLYKVVAHELTHQFIQERWGRRPDDALLRKPTERGFWIVEGFAGYVEDQSVEMARYGLELDDATVSSIEIASAMLENGRLTPMADFLSMSQVALFRLKGPTFEVQLEREALVLGIDPMAGYYAQAAALTFFLVQRSGPETRDLFFDALEAHYVGKTPRDGARALGFESAEALDEAFRTFLADPIPDGR